MTIDAILLGDRRHAVVVVSGQVEPGCAATLAESLLVSARCHTVVDLRQVEGITPELVKPLLAALGRALDRGRTLRVVVRDQRQRHFLHAVGVGSMVPLHDSLAEALAAVDAVIPRARPHAPVTYPERLA